MATDSPPTFHISNSGGKAGRSGPPGNSNARKSGSYRASLELKELVRRSMDGRTTEAREVAQWIGDLVADLGGIDNLSTQERTILEVAGHTRLQLARVDAFLANMRSLVHRKRRQLYPIVLQRQALADGLCKRLDQIGLKRRAKDVSLEAYLATRAASGATENQPEPPSGGTEVETNETPAPAVDNEQH